MLEAGATFSPLVRLALVPLQWSTISAIPAIVACLAVALVSAFFLRSTTSDKIHELGGIPVLTAWDFFRKRFDFVQGHFEKSGGKMFRFRVLQHRVVAVTGEEARKIFFTDQSLNLDAGYKILLGSAPLLEDINIQVDGDDKGRSFVNRLLVILRKDRVADTVPLLLNDLHARVVDWGKTGKINPFKEVYDLVFQMNVRIATCRELSEDREAVEELARHYLGVEQNSTPAALLLPWFPSPAKKAKEKSILGLYLLISKYVTMRRESKTPSTDPIDLLIANGASDDLIIGTVIGIIFAGVLNTGVTVCWALLNLAAHPNWKERLTEEYNTLVANHTNTLSTEPLHKRLASVPLNAWEDELPSVDRFVRETLRFTISGPTLRRNMLQDITVDGVTIKRGDFMVYSTFEAHMNPDIYSNPTSFDPDRYLEGREEDKNETFAFLGWGAGRHPCAGIKLAKLEIKLVLALMLLGYKYELVDKSGQYPDPLPVPDRNDILLARPLGEPCYLKFERVME